MIIPSMKHWLAIALFLSHGVGWCTVRAWTTFGDGIGHLNQRAFVGLPLCQYLFILLILWCTIPSSLFSTVIFELFATLLPIIMQICNHSPISIQIQQVETRNGSNP
jgi:hypothetical protein